MRRAALNSFCNLGRHSGVQFDGNNFADLVEHADRYVARSGTNLKDDVRRPKLRFRDSWSRASTRDSGSEGRRRRLTWHLLPADPVRVWPVEIGNETDPWIFENMLADILVELEDVGLGPAGFGGSFGVSVVRGGPGGPRLAGSFDLSHASAMIEQVVDKDLEQ